MEKNYKTLELDKVLEMLGYKMSVSEREYINGTHEAFVKEDKGND